MGWYMPRQGSTACTMDTSQTSKSSSCCGISSRGRSQRSWDCGACIASRARAGAGSVQALVTAGASDQPPSQEHSSSASAHGRSTAQVCTRATGPQSSDGSSVHCGAGPGTSFAPPQDSVRGSRSGSSHEPASSSSSACVAASCVFACPSAATVSASFCNSCCRCSSSLCCFFSSALRTLRSAFFANNFATRSLTAWLTSSEGTDSGSSMLCSSKGKADEGVGGTTSGSGSSTLKGRIGRVGQGRTKSSSSLAFPTKVTGTSMIASSTATAAASTSSQAAPGAANGG
mmetsp:Transcript_70442/g.183456  ORF Transcript_70442/g.183456 Transcript_70442/m.183456 type:complete len:287 (+) Transcript_70442:513-1373(+)